ncbi:TLD domain-containing protein 1 [Nymphaea thermarum]|nr:TLD domain-containing protein 1 [Nymphaea thermarum]
MHGTIFSSKCVKDGCNSYLNIVEVLLNAATFSVEVRGSEHTMSFNEFRNWCNLLPSVRKFLGGLLTGNSGRLGSPVPRQLYPEDLYSVLIMKEQYAWVIGGALTQQELEEWKLLYHSSVDGLSFNTFLGNIMLGNGPTILLVKDKAGYIYGGYASQPWDRHSEFYGDMKSFLFTLYPRPSVFRPSGLNTNLQWSAWNFSSENVPNGIGFGGRVNHFGLFLSASFDSGHSFQCSTFNSPCLSLETQIVPETIECWGVIVKDIQQLGKPEPVKGNVLQRFKEDRHMLNMVGLANSSVKGQKDDAAGPALFIRSLKTSV